MKRGGGGIATMHPLLFRTKLVMDSVNPLNCTLRDEEFEFAVRAVVHKVLSLQVGSAVRDCKGALQPTENFLLIVH